jgi:flagellin-like protein
MKANQAFKQDGEAVSPVIGVILMVAITVVLAAVVFVLVSNLSKNSNTTAPNVTFQQDQTAHKLTIVSADASASWANVKQTTTGAGCSVKFQGTTTVTSGSTVATGSISAGDFLIVSTTTTSPASCTVSLTYTTVNQLLGTWTFNF